MGGGHALGIGSENLETFGWIGGFSSGVPMDNFEDRFPGLLAAHESTALEPELLWIACGEDDFLLERNEAIVAWLKAKGINHKWVKSTGGHSWPVWRDYWEQFLSLLF